MKLPAVFRALLPTCVAILCAFSSVKKPLKSTEPWAVESSDANYYYLAEEVGGGDEIEGIDYLCNVQSNTTCTIQIDVVNITVDPITGKLRILKSGVIFVIFLNRKFVDLNPTK
ncbi:hypothetical protein [Chitinophaga arvensicola]|uniref:Uncharacterized protein n=1 Tax=Chitinophaga arvensicola TaxID=29529 RepID=A0A1I0PMB0_9BACT|nr:hypothetical protein [Chitinophaga arvensicola]SEW15506.1 hypothetical protein SAMN04488122_0866 [Chitinophaga arvensicola]